MDIVIASTNRGKVREFTDLLVPLGFDVYSLSDYSSIPEIQETGETFEENARIKALAVSSHLRRSLVLSDDSGLVVPALGGRPGIFSARFASPLASDLDNRRQLLKELESIEDRSAYFECVLCLAQEAKVIKVATGRCEGFIANGERGSHGFGYDPVFIKNDYSKTFAELGPKIKAQVSHRRKAWDKLADFLGGVVKRG